MHDPFQLIVWALAIVISWEILAGATGFQDWLKNMSGRKSAAQALEARVRELEQKKSSAGVSPSG